MLSFREEGWGWWMEIYCRDFLLTEKKSAKSFYVKGLMPRAQQFHPGLLLSPIRPGFPGLTWRCAKESGHEEAQGGHIGSQKQPPLLLHQCGQRRHQSVHKRCEAGITPGEERKARMGAGRRLVDQMKPFGKSGSGSPDFSGSELARNQVATCRVNPEPQS